MNVSAVRYETWEGTGMFLAVSPGARERAGHPAIEFRLVRHRAVIFETFIGHNLDSGIPVT